MKVIFDLCGGTGSWSKPYKDAGYDVRRVDIDTNRIDVRLMELPAQAIHGVLAAPPCTVFANSGARWTRTDDQIYKAMQLWNTRAFTGSKAAEKYFVSELTDKELDLYSRARVERQQTLSNFENLLIDDLTKQSPAPAK